MDMLEWLVNCFLKKFILNRGVSEGQTNIVSCTTGIKKTAPPYFDLLL